MLQQQTGNNWSFLLNFIIQSYLKDFTICILWHTSIEFNLNSHYLEDPYAIISIEMKALRLSLGNNVVDFGNNRLKLEENDLYYNELTEKLFMSIEKSHCEAFIAFDEHIVPLIDSFQHASQYSVWRSKRNHFIFGLLNYVQEELLQQHKFFLDQPNILIITSYFPLSSYFDLKTNKFKGPTREQQRSLYQLDRFFSENQTFLFNTSLFPDKIRNLEGREVIIAGFDYRPYSVVNYVKLNNNSYDLAYGNSPEGQVEIGGTETRVVLVFCEIHNCRVQIDSSEADDWGEVFANLSGSGSLGMVAKGLAEVAVGAMYSWDTDYIYLDMSMYLARTGVTNLVPAPKRLASWLLPLEPFQFTLWSAVGIYITIEIVSLTLTHRFETHHVAGSKSSWYQSLNFAVVTTLKLFVSQSGNAFAISWTVRVLLFSCFMNDIIITSIYGGGLASILTVPSYDEAADTVDRMISFQLEWAANSEAWVSTLRNTDDPRIKGIMKNFHLLSDEKIKKLAESQSGYGFPVERLAFGHYAIADFFTPELLNHLKIMQEDLYYQYTVAFVPRCWPLLAPFDELIYWWHSAGLDRYWEWREVADNMNVQQQKQVEASMYSYMGDIGPVKLGMSNFVGILLIWVLGISMAILVFLYEVVGAHLKERQDSLLTRQETK